MLPPFWSAADCPPFLRSKPQVKVPPQSNVTATIATLPHGSFRSCSRNSPYRSFVRRAHSSTCLPLLRRSLPVEPGPTVSMSNPAPLRWPLPPPACAARILQERARCERNQERDESSLEPICPCSAPSPW